MTAPGLAVLKCGHWWMWSYCDHCGCSPSEVGKCKKCSGNSSSNPNTNLLVLLTLLLTHEYTEIFAEISFLRSQNTHTPHPKQNYYCGFKWRQSCDSTVPHLPTVFLQSEEKTQNIRHQVFFRCLEKVRKKLTKVEKTAVGLWCLNKLTHPKRFPSRHPPPPTQWQVPLKID